MYFLLIARSLQFYIKNLSDDLYMSDVSNGKNERSVISSDKSKRVNFSSTINPDGSQIIKPDTSNHVFDVKGKSELIYYNKHGAKNQQFKFILLAPKTYLLQSIDKCVEYSKSSKKYLVNTCNSKDEQKFVVITEEDEQNSSNENLFYRSSKVTEYQPRDQELDGSDVFGYSKNRLPVITSDSKHIAHHTHHHHGGHHHGGHHNEGNLKNHHFIY